MRKNRIILAAIAALLSITMLAGCTSADKSESANTSSSTETTGSTSASVIAASIGSVDVTFDSSDYSFDWQSGSYTTLDMSGGSQTVTKSGVYEITGRLADGSLIIDIDKSADAGTVYLVLNNVSITSETSAPLYVKDAKKVVLILEDNTSNTMSQGSGVVVDSDNEPSAAIFSKADLTITGGGSLNVISDYNDGITSKDTMKITDGTLCVRAKNDGITGKDLLAVEKGSITIIAGKDGLRSTNETDEGMGSILIKDGVFDINTGNDAIQAYGVLQIDNGSFDLTSGGGYAGIITTNSGFGQDGMAGHFNSDSAIPDPGTDGDSSVTQTTTGTAGGTSNTADDSVSESDSKKCLKATDGIILRGGTFLTSSYEDSIHSGGGIDITGGVLNLQAGDDAIHSDMNVTISGGTVTIVNSYEGIEGTSITVNGGDIRVTASDDGFNVNDGAGVLSFSGGTVYVDAGGDGLDSNGSVIMTGGTVYVDGPINDGNGAIDYQMGFAISGGTMIAAGSSGMAQTGDMSSSQPSILMYYASAQAAGTAVTVKDDAGNTVASFTPSKQYASAAITAPGLKTGLTFTLYSGDTAVVTFTLSDTVTYLSESGVTTNQGMGPGGGQLNGGQFGSKPDGGQFHGGAPFGEKPDSAG